MERKALIILDGKVQQMPDGDELEGAGDMVMDVYDPDMIQADVYDITNHKGRVPLANVSDAGTAAGLEVGLEMGKVAPGDHGHVCCKGDMHTNTYDPNPPSPDPTKDIYDRTNHFGFITLEDISDSGEAAALDVGPKEITLLPPSPTVGGKVAPGDHEHLDYMKAATYGVTGAIDLFERTNHTGLIPVDALDNAGECIVKNVGSGPDDVAPAIHSHPVFLGINDTPADGYVPAPTPDDRLKVLGSHGEWSTITELFELNTASVDVSALPQFQGASDSADGETGIVLAPGSGEELHIFSGDGTWRTISDLTTDSSIPIDPASVARFRDATDVDGAERGKIVGPVEGQNLHILLGRSNEDTPGHSWSTIEQAILDSEIVSWQSIDNFVGVPVGATDPGKPGLVPAPTTGSDWHVLIGEGDFSSINNVIANTVGTLSASSFDPFEGPNDPDPGKVGVVPEQTTDESVLLGDATWGNINTVLSGAASSISADNVPLMEGPGEAGVAPAPTALDKALRGNGTWAEPPPSYTWKGEWDAGTAYKKQYDHVVLKDGDLCLAIADSTGSDPVSTPASWELLAENGALGFPGPEGLGLNAEFIKASYKNMAHDTNRILKIKSGYCLKIDHEYDLYEDNLSRNGFTYNPDNAEYNSTGNGFLQHGPIDTEGFDAHFLSVLVECTESQANNITLQVSTDDGVVWTTLTPNLHPQGSKFIVWGTYKTEGDVNTRWRVETVDPVVVQKVLYSFGDDAYCADVLTDISGNGIELTEPVVTVDFPKSIVATQGLHRIWHDLTQDVLRITRPDPGIIAITSSYRASSTDSRVYDFHAENFWISHAYSDGIEVQKYTYHKIADSAEVVHKMGNAPGNYIPITREMFDLPWGDIAFEKIVFQHNVSDVPSGTWSEPRLTVAGLHEGKLYTAIGDGYHRGENITGRDFQSLNHLDPDQIGWWQITTTDPVSSDTDWVDVAISSYGCMAIKGDGTLWAWGEDGRYNGLSTSDPVIYPTRIDPYSHYLKVDGGLEHYAILDTQGRLWGAANTTEGKYAIGSPPNLIEGIPIHPHPKPVLENVKDFACGPKYTIALLMDGSVWFAGRMEYWGANLYKNKWTLIDRWSASQDWEPHVKITDHTAPDFDKILSCTEQYALFLKNGVVFCISGNVTEIITRQPLGDYTQDYGFIEGWSVPMFAEFGIYWVKYYTNYFTKEDRSLWGRSANYANELKTGATYTQNYGTITSRNQSFSNVSNYVLVKDIASIGHTILISTDSASMFFG